MLAEQWRQIESVYHAAFERAPEDRARFLDEAGAVKMDVLTAL